MATEPIRPPVAPPAVPGMKPMAPPAVPGAPGKAPMANAPTAPGVAAKGVAPRPPGSPPIPGEPVEGEEEHHPQLGFWQQPWVQNVLPLVTSVSVHAAILILGLLIWGVAKVVAAKAAEQQTIIPDSTLAENGPPGGIPNVGPTAGDVNKAFAQDVDPTQGSKDKFSDSNKSLDVSKSGGNESDNSNKIFDNGAGAPGGPGHSGGAGAEGGGGMAMFGTPGGGGIGPKGAVFGNGGNAHQIVFLCDATGSMLSKMATLKDELTKAVTGLKAIQSFDVLFFQDNSIVEFSKTLGPPQLVNATPDTKRKAAAYLEGITSTGTTNPIPALEASLKLHPQLMYLLTDAADFPDTKAVVDTINKYNKDRAIHINTILFVEDKAEHEKNVDSEVLMKQIANENGGKFRWVEMDALQQ